MPPVDLSASIYMQYKRARQRAEEAEKRGALKEAGIAYKQAAEFMKQFARSTQNQKTRNTRFERAKKLEEIALRFSAITNMNTIRDAGKTIQRKDATSDDDYETQVIGLIQRTETKWEDIGGLDESKNAIKVAYGLALAKKPEGVFIDSWRNFLLYGPPGTGKTLLASATAGNLDATFFNVKVSDLLSKYFGESTKLISALYSAANRLSPSVIFLDEFESLTRQRDLGESGAERRIVSTLLAEIDGFKNKGTNNFVITIGATNLPWLIDSALLSRFQKRVYVPLPDNNARSSILKIFIHKRGHKTMIPLDGLIIRTEGYSGREIEQICQMAVTSMTQRANPNMMSLVDKGRDAIQGYQVRVEPLTEQDFDMAFREVQKGTDIKSLQRYETWQKKEEM